MSKNPVGRPKKTVEETLPENWQELIIEWMSEGCSKVEVRAKMLQEMRKNDPEATLSRGLFWRWMNDNEDFLETIKEGQELSKSWWLNAAKENLIYTQGSDNRRIDATLWYMNMKNRFGWTDRQDITTDGDKIQSVQVSVVNSKDGSED